MLIDAHAHLDLYENQPGVLDAALEEIAAHRIFTVGNSMDLPSYQCNLDIGERSDLICPIFGVHPWSAPEYADRLGELHEAVTQSPMLGEIGLDFHFVEDASRYPSQRRVFDHFLTAAREQDKIVHLHTKGAEAEVLRLLDRHRIRRALIHWYSGPLDVFREAAARGVYFTIGLSVLDDEHIRAIARLVPLSQLLTETDNPGGPRNLIGDWAKPSLIRDVVRELAALRDMTEDDLIQTVRANLLRLIGDDPRLASVRATLLRG